MKLRAVRADTLCNRINEKLDASGKGEVLERSQGSLIPFFGAYYLVANKAIQQHHVDLESFARQLGILRPFEYLHRLDAEYLHRLNAMRIRATREE